MFNSCLSKDSIKEIIDKSKLGENICKLYLWQSIGIRDYKEFIQFNKKRQQPILF